MGTNQLYSTNHRGTGNPLIDADADPTVLALWTEIFGEVSCLMAEPSGLSRKDIVHMASAFGKNLPKFDSTKGNAEGYVRAVVELIQQMGLQNYPNEMLTYLGKNLGSGTAEGNVIDGLMDRAKEQATEILVQQRRSDGEIGAMTHTRNPKFGEYRVVKLLRSIVNHFSRRETPYETETGDTDR